MPRLSKVRIVNFNYNDGNRLIADELFDFTCSDNKNAMNVLFNLANGGGKSVLVQLMMQPIIPKAKVAGRRIESFFDKGGNHFFVLLEWLKDDSPEKLLTGIAMASREISKRDYSSTENNSGGISFKYYTFYSNYQSEDDYASIVNLPLSKKTQGNFEVVDYDYVRKIAKKKRDHLYVYASEDNSMWHNKLCEYGIKQDEWRMIEGLNSEEGGLGKYFGKFKTSDNLIDNLLIPFIEKKTSFTELNGDASLSTLLMDHAKKYAQKEKTLKNLKDYKSFKEYLIKLQPQANDLWNIDDRAKEGLSRLFGFINGLNELIGELERIQTVSEEKLKLIEENKKHVKWEEISANYYKRQEELKNISDDLGKAYEKQEFIKTKLDETIYNIKLFKCASYYKKIIKLNSEIYAVQLEIQNREKEGKSGVDLLSYKYSACCAIKDEIKVASEEHGSLKNTELELSEHLREVNDKLCALQKIKDSKRDDLNRKKGCLDQKLSETDKIVLELSKDLHRRLDGNYYTEDLEPFKTKHDKKLSELESEKISVQKQIAENEQENINNPCLISKFEYNLSDIQRIINAAVNEIENYDLIESKIKNIFEQYNLDFSNRFTGELQEFLSLEYQKTQNKCSDVQRKISILEEEIKAVNNGTLHISKAVLEYLNSTGAVYNTCEKYLLDLVKNGNITEDKCLEILRNFPMAAYGIIMDEGSIKEVTDYGREEWLPSMIPIFSHEQMADIVDIKKEDYKAVAFYSVEYFTNSTNFGKELERQKQQFINQQKLLNARVKEIELQRKTAELFNYESEWKNNKNLFISEQKKDLDSINNQIEGLKKRIIFLKEQIESLREKDEQLTNLINHEYKFRDFVNSFINSIEIEKSMNIQIAQLEKELENAEDKLKEYKIEESSLKESLESVGDKIQNSLKLQVELKDGLTEVEECDQTDLIQGSWRDLLCKYREIQKTMNLQIDALNEKLSGKTALKNSYEEEISKLKIPLNNYENMEFDSKQLSILESEESDLEKQFELSRDESTKIYGRKSKSEVYFKQVEEALKTFGGPLVKSEIGSDFDKRLNGLNSNETELRKEIEIAERKQKNTEKILNKSESFIEDKKRPSAVGTVVLKEDLNKQFLDLKNEYKKELDDFNDIYAEIHGFLCNLSDLFKNNECGISNAIAQMTSMLTSEIRGDRFYTLTEHISGNLKNTDLAIGRIQTELSDFNKEQADLVKHCCIQGKRIYDGLKQMESSSKVDVHEGKPKQKMIRFDIPEEVDTVVASGSIAEELNYGIKELAEMIKDSSIDEIKKRAKADKIVGSKTLFRKYIGKDNILVKAYKIDQNPENSGYRNWEETQVNNSGAEKFIVYFAVILSLIHYTRNTSESLRSKELHSALILDNPFGATSSKHILQPMFRIAEHFNVQMICLSDINKSEVVNCFNMVIKVIVKKRPMSNHELLTHEGNELIEHGFYKAEQMTLF